MCIRNKHVLVLVLIVTGNLVFVFINIYTIIRYKIRSRLEIIYVFFSLYTQGSYYL